MRIRLCVEVSDGGRLKTLVRRCTIPVELEVRVDRRLPDASSSTRGSTMNCPNTVVPSSIRSTSCKATMDT
jgi:hypothetical protein